MISIIIIVKSDREIENTLNSLKKVKKPEKTEIIVIDASKEEILLDIKNKFPDVKWFYYENKTNKKITIPEQRNMGIKKSKGDIIVFVDAGCTVEKDWLKELIKPIRKKEELITSGIIKSLNKKNIHNIIWQKRRGEYLLECGAANLALNKKILKNKINFDETLEAGEDMDLTWNLINKGYKILYVPHAIMYHNWGNLKQEIKRAIKYGESRWNLYLKHKDRRWKFKNSGLDLFTLYSLGFFIYVISIIPFTYFWGYYPLFLLIPLIKNIRNNPLRKIIFDFFWGYGTIKQMISKK